ncbi:hypothetical protein RB195_026081 [Necator americanus]|uniref:SLC12A transporter C-terminal domain-containing protein n=1 Tax=Necator americanus TaxID=51031 RepID=A0ABR1EVA1_NECAM
MDLRKPLRTTTSRPSVYDELIALVSRIVKEQVVIVSVNANAKVGLEQQSDVLEKWYYLAERYRITVTVWSA